MMKREDKIEKLGSKWIVKSKSGRPMGEYDTEEEAVKRLAQVEAFGALEEGESPPKTDADWDTAFVNRLPDSAFLWIGPGGEKDGDGKTVPRSLRKFPVRGPDGAVDLPHLRNALARLPDSDIPADAKTRLAEKARGMLEKANKSDALELVRRVDYLGAIHFDPERQDGAFASVDPNTGFLRVDARLTRVGVFTYGDKDGNTWGELRTEDEVFDAEAMRSFELSILTDDHPDEFVTAANVRDVAVGTVGSDVRRDGDFLVASILVTDPLTIAKIRDGKTELSCGYTAAVIQDAGVTGDGTPFAGRQTRIRGNHVAIVDRGRAGPDCRLLVDSGDAFSLQPTQGEPMPQSKNTARVKIDGEEIEVDERVAHHIEKIKADAAEKKTMKTEHNDDADALRARLDLLEAQAAEREKTEGARIDARVALVTAARSILGADTRVDGVSDSEIMRSCVLAVTPTLEGRLDANKDAPGYLRAAFDAAVDLHAKRDSALLETSSAIFEAMKSDGEDDLDAAYQDFVKTRNTVRLVAGGEG